jgi:hypothetical protein
MTISPFVTTQKGDHIRTACLLRSIASRVRWVGSRRRVYKEGSCASKAEELANQIEALAMSVDLAERGMPDADRQAGVWAKKLMRV